MPLGVLKPDDKHGLSPCLLGSCTPLPGKAVMRIRISRLRTSRQRDLKESLRPRFVRDALFKGGSEVDQPEFTFLEAESRPFGVVLAPNGHTTLPVMSCIATHDAP
jgi:hypothetical protein